MATTYVYVERPVAYNYATDTYDEEDLLRVEMDVDGKRLIAVLPFADYAGLEAEWNAGSVSTVFEAACVSWLSSEGDGTDPAPTPYKDEYGDPVS